MIFNVLRDNKRSKKKFKGRTILDHVLSKQPDFDPKRHKVFINDLPVDDEAILETLSGPLDVIAVSPV